MNLFFQSCQIIESKHVHFHFLVCLLGLEGEQKFHLPKVRTLYAGKYDTFFRKSL